MNQLDIAAKSRLMHGGGWFPPAVFSHTYNINNINFSNNLNPLLANFQLVNKSHTCCFLSTICAKYLYKFAWERTFSKVSALRDWLTPTGRACWHNCPWVWTANMPPTRTSCPRVLGRTSEVQRLKITAICPHTQRRGLEIFSHPNYWALFQ